METSNLDKLLSQQEPLCDELLPYVRSGQFGQMLHHPLIISISYRDQHAALYNAQYRAKSLHLTKLLDERNFSNAIFLHERPYRFDALMEYRTDYDFHNWETIAQVWSDSENIYETLEDWKWLWSSDHTGRECVMTLYERAALLELPEVLDIYRGISHSGRDEGMSWTTQRNKAVWFAKRFGDHPRILTGQVSRSDVYALLLGRGESEIVVDPEFITLVDETPCL